MASNRKICIIEYMGISSANGQLMGHSYKVLEDYYRMLEDGCFDLSVIVPQNAVGSVKDTLNIRGVLPKYIVMRDNDSVLDKIKKILLEYKNIHDACNLAKGDLLWFYNVDFSFIIYMFLHWNKRKCVICNLYRRNFSRNNSFIGKIKNRFSDYVLKRIKLLVCTGYSFLTDWSNSFFMPDYYYIPTKYDELGDKPKENKVVCLGNMNRFKLLDQVVETFNKLDIHLEIIGKFYDEEWRENLKKKAKENIIIQDIYLMEEEYLNKLSEAKFCIIPYDFKMYNQRTSGVLQECIFLRTVPITFDWFLQQNAAEGIGIKRLCDLTIENIKDFKYRDYKKWCELQIKEIYNLDKIRSGFIKNLMD